MASTDPDRARNPLPQIAILLLAAGVLVKAVALAVAAPADDGRETTVGASPADALGTFWDDPLIGVRQPGAPSSIPAERTRGKPMSELTAQLREAIQSSRSLKVLAVMVYGGANQEASLQRRRTRYAVVSAIRVSGYIPPVDAGLLSYVNDGTRIVPYEWFVGDRERVLVLWLQEETLRRPLVPEFTQLAKTLCAGVSPACDVGTGPNPLLVVGPGGSGALAALVAELHDRLGGDSLELQAHMRFYSPFATVPDDYLLNMPQVTSDRALVPGAWKKRIAILRTIGGDDALAAALVEELALRNINPPGDPCQDAVAIVSDVDAGRFWVHAMRQRLNQNCNLPVSSPVALFSYMPGSGSALSDATRRKDGALKSPNQDEKEGLIREVIASLLGLGQFDGTIEQSSLNGIAEELVNFDANHRARGGNGVRAIGVFGTSVNDKLRVLQALRARFPSAVFFTTDLDLLLAHPNESKWARNLVVASNFGLALNPGLQGAVPPFQDSYQTAAFLATRIALLRMADQGPEQMQQMVAAWLAGGRPSASAAEPLSNPFGGKRIYEIGRTRPVALDPNGAVAPCESLDARCPNLHELRRSHVQALDHYLLGAAVVALSGVALLAITSRRVQGALEAWWTSPHRLWSAVVAVALAAGIMGFLRAIGATIDAGRGEPFLLLEGLSAWPNAILRLAAIALSVWFLRRGWRRLRHALAILDKAFQFSTNDAWRERAHARGKGIAALLLGRLQLWRAAQGAWSVSDDDGRDKVDVATLWLNYRERYYLAPMQTWMLLTTIVFVLFVGVLTALEGPAVIASRGHLARYTNLLLGSLSSMMFVILVFAVMYVTRTTTAFIAFLSDPRSDWPEATLVRFMKRTGLPKDLVGGWIGFRLVVVLTELVNGLVYAPFVVLLLLVVGWSSLFSKFPPPLALVASGLVLLGYAVFCVVSLRRAAETTRRRALQSYEDRLLVLKGDPRMLRRELNEMNGGSTAKAAYDPRLVADQVEHLLQRIRDTQEGAFLPLTRQPIVHAVLTLVGGYFGISLIEWFTLVRF